MLEASRRTATAVTLTDDRTDQQRSNSRATCFKEAKWPGARSGVPASVGFVVG